MENFKYKLFSKKWFENYWYYYKWYTIGGAVLLVSLVLLIGECAFRVKPDFSLNYVGNPDYNFVQLKAYELEDKLAGMVKDVNGDKKQSVKVNLMYLDKNDKSKEATFMFQLADVEMATGEAAVYIFDSEYVDRYSKYGFFDLTEYVDKYRIPSDMVLMDEARGYPYAINLTGNKILEDLEIETEELYLVLRPMRDNENKKMDALLYENSLEMAEYILSNNKQ